MLVKQLLNRYASTDVRGAVAECSRDQQRKLNRIAGWQWVRRFGRVRPLQGITPSVAAATESRHIDNCQANDMGAFAKCTDACVGRKTPAATTRGSPTTEKTEESCTRAIFDSARVGRSFHCKVAWHFKLYRRCYRPHYCRSAVPSVGTFGRSTRRSYRLSSVSLHLASPSTLSSLY